jgi:hypothetical protein
MPFLYGGNIVKAHVGRWSEECPEHVGVVVCGMDDTPLVRYPPCRSATCCLPNPVNISLKMETFSFTMLTFVTGLRSYCALDCGSEKA